MSGIYALPEKPSAIDIIERSIIAHPSLFADSLRSQEIMHKGYSAQSTNTLATRGANASARACERAREFAQRDDLSARERASLICAETGPAVIALNVACKLQCLPPHVRTAAAVMLDSTPLEQI